MTLFDPTNMTMTKDNILKYNIPGPIDKVSLSQFVNGFKSMPALKPKIVFEIHTITDSFVMKVTLLKDNILDYLTTDTVSRPDELQLLLDINDASTRSPNIVKWKHYPIVYDDKIERGGRPGRYKIEPKLLLFYEKGDITLDNAIHENPSHFTKHAAILCVTDILNGIIALQEKQIIHMDLKIDNIIYKDKTYQIIDLDEAVKYNNLSNKVIQNNYKDRILTIRAFKQLYNSTIQPDRLTVENSAYVYDLYLFLTTLFIHINKYPTVPKPTKTLIKWYIDTLERLINYKSLTPNTLKRFDNTIFKRYSPTKLPSLKRTKSLPTKLPSLKRTKSLPTKTRRHSLTKTRRHSLTKTRRRSPTKTRRRSL